MAIWAGKRRAIPAHSRHHDEPAFDLIVDGERRVITLHRQLDEATASLLRNAAAELAGQPGDITIEFADQTFISAAGTSVITSIGAALRERGDQLRLVHLGRSKQPLPADGGLASLARGGSRTG